ncbi:hypothetical protein crov295 [Cafeteria roenbergensis virus]|uniref:Uncharacterized protein n=1 Tax=Cafeteria roenbergensis virus (strain BV-PW1) TaxID=693272 RepID=E3T565_CROVB|nr:hypothetical protein crov295 [Cafeteria roenbergensis virus BV-PW1]ADO67328.1 hypothetical protein crov295 [Cafeteria roenbergensis virus BV-PW1]
MEELIPIYLNKYDEAIYNYSYLINYPFKEYLIDTSSTPVSDGRIHFKDNKDNEDFYLDAFFLGAYHNNDKIWIWNWCHPLPSKNLQLGNILVNYALNFDEQKLKRDDFMFIRSTLVNSRIQINDDVNLDILKGLIMHITKVKVIIPIEFSINNKKIIYYYGIKSPSNKILL